MIAFITHELSNPIIDNRLFSFQIVAAFMYFTMAFWTDENLKALVDFFGRDFSEESETHIAMWLENFFV